MDIEELRNKQAEFEGTRKELKNKFSNLNKLRKKFVDKFNMTRLSKLPIDEYVVGRGAKNTFSYGLETELMELGKIKGGSPADKKFGIYYGQTKSDHEIKYRWIKRFGSNQEDAYNNVREEVISLLKAGHKNNIDEIVANKLSPMFKGKILSTYYPDKYLNIFSNEHLDYFIEKAGLLSEETTKMGEIQKREMLMQFKKSDDVMKEWSIFEFYTFLYEKLGRPVSDIKSVSKSLMPYIESKYPPINEVNAEFVNFAIGDLPPNNQKTKPTARLKPDYEKINRENKRLGDRGELIVLIAENKKLKSLGRAEKIDHTSKKFDSAGYDILSYDENGNKKYIEVKSTKSKGPFADFIITTTELEKAKQLNNYFIYIVFEAHTNKPKIFALQKPFVLKSKQIDIKPVNYRVQINLKEKINN